MRPGIVLAAALLPALAAGGPALDWSRRVLRCSGTAAPTLRESAENVAVTRPGTLRRAREAAVRACLAGLRGAPLGSDGTVGDALDRDPALAARVEEVVARTRPLPPVRMFADGGVALELEVPLDGPLRQLLGPLGPRAAAAPAGAAGPARTAPPGAPAAPALPPGPAREGR